MKTHPPITPSKTILLADLQQITAVVPLEREGRRRQLLGSLRRITKVLGKPSQQILVNPEFADRLRRIKPQLHGMTKRRWDNIIGDLRFCCRAAGINVGRSYTPMTAAWQALDDLVDPELRRRLVRFARWCSEAGIEPDMVDDEVAAKHLERLRDGEFSKNPYHGYRLLARLWNECGERFPQWPAYRFILEDRRHRVNLAWEDFPESLRADLASWEKQVSSGFEFDLEASVPARPLAPRTIQTRKHQLLTLASAAVEAGHPASSITSLAILCQKSVYVDALKLLRTRHDKKASSWLANIAGSILPIARHHVKLAESSYRELRRICSQVTPVHQGLNQKNKQRLDRFKSERLVDRLHALPASIFRRLRSLEPNRQRAVTAQTALAVQILLDAPIRLANLTGLHLERHLIRHKDMGRQTAMIVFGAAEVKNQLDLSLPIPLDTIRMLDEYLKVYHPLLAPEGSPWLFPGRPAERPKAATGLSTQISRFLLEQLGIEMNAHLFRHLAAMLYLRLNPGSYETVRVLLGHKSVDTTISAYACFEREAAIRHYQDTVLPRKRS